MTGRVLFTHGRSTYVRVTGVEDRYRDQERAVVEGLRAMRRAGLTRLREHGLTMFTDRFETQAIIMRFTRKEDDDARDYDME